MFGFRKATLAVLAGGISAALLLSTGTGALAAAASNVVPANGTVAGHGYGYWLQRLEQATFSSSPPVHPCQTLAANGQRVAYLALATSAPGTDKYTCNEPAGRPMYVVELGNECSTFKGDHPRFGTSDSQLMRCARALFKGVTETTTIDGHSVNVSKLVAATGVYPVYLAKHNDFGIPPGKGRSAAYGFGLLLTGFAKGIHIIHTVASVGTVKWDVTFTVHVH
jgi:hypothetical protein